MNDYWSANDEFLNGRTLWKKLNQDGVKLVTKENRIVSNPYELDYLKSVFVIQGNVKKPFWKLF